MGLHYNAFISYRHHPDDIKVASEIHRGLERFHIPRTLKKKVKPITRLFRDKEELPITSDLNDDIGYALENADFLIVICSVHTKESIWVQREIETFLKTHPRNRVLTVLASGEPYDVIPDILLHDTITEPETGETRQIEVEPLSCDWREPSRRKRMQEELPRLAAALMGCAYDELRQRQRQYRMHRLITIFSISLAASLALAAYFLYTSITIRNANIQIQANYEQSQRNQSRHLATAAQERLDAGDRLTAISLAVAALPSEENPRPYVPEAEYVLSSALGVYNNNYLPVAIGAISPGTNLVIDDFWLTDDDKTMYLLDQRNIITAWNTETLEKLGSISLSGSYLEKLLVTSAGDILLFENYGGYDMSCYGPDGTKLWTLDNCNDFALLDDGSSVLAIVKTDTGYCLSFLDAKTGVPLRQSLDLTHPAGKTPNEFYTDRYYSGLPIAIAYYGDSQREFCLADPVTGAITTLNTETVYPDLVSMTDNGKLLVMSADSDILVGLFETTRLSAPVNCCLDCYDTTTGELLWTSNLEVYSYGIAFDQIPGTDKILFIGGSIFHTLDAATGEVLSRCDAGSNVVAFEMEENYAVSVLVDGYTCNFWYEENYCYTTPCMENGLICASIGNGYAGLQLGDTQVTLYQVMETPADWTYHPDSTFTVDDQYFCGSLMAYSDNYYIYLMELNHADILWQIEKGNADLLGFSPDGSQVLIILDNAYLVSVDLATQGVSHQILPSSQLETYTSITSNYFLAGEQVLYTYKNDEEHFFTVYDRSTESSLVIPMFPESDVPEDIYLVKCTVLGSNGTHAWVWVNTGYLYEMDLTTMEMQVVDESLPLRSAVSVNEQGDLVAIANSEGILLKTPGGDILSQITVDDASVGSLYFLGNELLALCDNGFLYCYDSAGILKARIKLAVGPSFSSEIFDDYNDSSRLSWRLLSENTLLVSAYGYCNIIDLENMALQASLSGFIGYLPDSHQFVCKAYSGDLIAIPHYSTQELLQLALEQLNGYALTGEQKAAYGIE